MTVQVHVNSTDRSWHLVALENLDTFAREAFKATPENTDCRSVTGPALPDQLTPASTIRTVGACPARAEGREAHSLGH
jgi:hypothetical protein